MVEILDSNWISNILNISFTLVIFLFGIPLLFIQTYVPENLRIYFSESEFYKKQFRSFRKSIIILFLIIIIFGNQGVKFFLKEKFCNAPQFCDSHGTWIALYYILTLLVFLYLTYYTYENVKNNKLQKENVKETILNDILEKVSIYQKEDREKLGNLYNIYSSDLDRIKLFDFYYRLMNNFIETGKYTGKEFKFILEKFFFDHFVKNQKRANREEIKKVVSFCEKLNQKGKNSADVSYITDEFLLQLSIKFIDDGDIYLLRGNIDCLRKLDAKQTTYYLIYYQMFKNNIYSFIDSEIREVNSLKLSSISSSDNKEEIIDNAEKIAKRINQIAYISFFYNKNKVAKERAFNYIKRYEIKKKEMVKAKEEFLRISYFNTAQSIASMANDFH